MFTYDLLDFNPLVYGYAERVEGLAHIIRHGEDLTDLSVPEDNAYIPIVIDEARRDGHKFSRLTPASMAVLHTALPGFITLGRSSKGDHTHLLTVLGEMAGRKDFLGMAFELNIGAYNSDQYDRILNEMASWDGKPIFISRNATTASVGLIQ
jgi:hypothetical protein